ncbi:MAG: proton-translocating transhydrogenase family protein [Holosporaceae bacterium]|jgi:NAD(P) transhydrogenase subunit alpha|nr:proton-translocating transhydrogenase family protein [Holosporaceae bacterium]
MDFRFPNIFDDFAFCWSIACNGGAPSSSGIHGITVFVLACILGYYVVWRVTPALHAPLMAVTNAISSVIVIGAIAAASQSLRNGPRFFGFMAIILLSINIFGGFMVTHRMLDMFRKK